LDNSTTKAGGHVVTATAPDPQIRPYGSPDDALKGSLSRFEALLDGGQDRILDASYFGSLEPLLRQLHARFRMHDAADHLCLAPIAAGVAPPELAEELHRLREEHPHILSQLDWLIRRIDSIADQALEDKDVFVLRAREFIAVSRRHQAEDDRLFDLAMWRDTGGEG
jgi:hypothetical protein